MEAGGLDSDAGHGFFVDLETSSVGVSVEGRTNLEAGGGTSTRDQLDDDLVAGQRSAAPVLADEGKEAMLDLVPLAGSGREVADGDGQADFVSEFL